MFALGFWCGLQKKFKNECVVTCRLVGGSVLFVVVVALLGIPQIALAAKLIVAPPKPSYMVGDTILVPVIVNSADASVNAFSGTVTFPKDLLQVTAVSKTGSVVSVWAEEPTFSNTDGSVHFEGVAMNPGFTGASGKIVTIAFKVKAAGKADLLLASGSVLANDGQGTNVLTDMISSTITLGAAKVVPQVTTPAPRPAAQPESNLDAPTISSRTHPNSDKWYPATTATFQWELPENALAVRFVSDKQQRTSPSGLGVAGVTEKTITGLDDGIHYFHVQVRDKSGWGAVGHYRFQIDSKPPQQFAVTLPGGTDTDDPRPSILFKAVDDTSGIDRYELTFFTNEDDVITVLPEDMPNGIYKPAALDQGKKLLIVRAFDQAGNKTTETVEFTVREVKGLVVTSYPQRINEEYALRITGRTFPRSNITFIMSDTVSGQQYMDQAYATSTGEFYFTWGRQLPAGTYVLTAVNKDSRGAISTLEPSLRIEITRSLWARIVDVVSRYFWLALGVLSALAGAIVLGWVIRHRRKGGVLPQ